ncbi:helix-hairpin-helix domain-containing protein [Saliterribacillus persicus]|uniref:Competence protein ComEA n=1 Tax=Saliterribacillus persicus TaxID=930114 RepID=A0A368XFN9_9BACI|nr:helix-hairpin-helix domain-containing protein [Saliterribacillus persicus]RCW65307.1 competence protein ComEA [Saliterribacillus persicus]
MIQLHLLKFLKQYSLYIIIFFFIVGWVIYDHTTEPKKVAESEIKIEELVQAEAANVPEENQSVLVVDIKGEVVSPGVFEMKEGARVKDVIKVAGGFTSESDQASINLAQKVYDEMVIVVYPIDEATNLNLSIVGEESSKIKINSATADEIESIPGIGEVKAQAIIEHRDTYGHFKVIEDLEQVSGIGAKTVEKMKEYILVP